MGKTVITWCDEEGCEAYALGRQPTWQHKIKMEGAGKLFHCTATWDYCPEHVRPDT